MDAERRLPEVTSGPGPGLDPLELREALRAAALDSGFDRVGFAPAEPPRNAEAYRAWLERGFHGEMGYMAREDSVRRRLDPRETLEGARTLIVVTLFYGEAGVGGDPGPGEADGRGIVARYARGRDYHDVFEERLDDLAARVRELAPDAATKRYVDYGPVLERDHAQRAGLGWIGKNTMLIHPDVGSYFLLGELITDLDLPPDDPFLPDRCGTCDRCIVACPTDAIVGPRELDARRCISYLTIELRGPIPVELRPAIGDRVFGCDICQEVCPWNDRPEIEARPGRLPSIGRPVAPDDMVAWADELAALDDGAFRTRYGGTALARPGRAGLLRNLAVGLGNTRPEGAAAVLVRLAEDRSDLVREHASWALEQIRPDGGRVSEPSA